jgi:Ca2+-binding RTX toxin-like protein
MTTRIRRAVVAVALTLIMATAFGGVAWAATFIGTNGGNSIAGTGGADVLYGLGGYDVLESKGGPDELYGGAGRDELYGGPGRDYLVGGSGPENWLGRGRGSDTVEAADQEKDFIQCGAGYDVVSVDELDTAQKCEEVNGVREP